MLRDFWEDYRHQVCIICIWYLVTMMLIPSKRPSLVVPNWPVSPLREQWCFSSPMLHQRASLELSYPNPLKYTFELFQKTFLELDTDKKMSSEVYNFNDCLNA